jgi:hypothetical protein
VGYFEHSSPITGSASLRFSFKAEVVNDALKSLIINDPESVAPRVSYPSSETLSATLRSLGFELSDDPGLPQLLAGRKGAEIRVLAPNEITGRIVGVEYRDRGQDGQEGWLMLFSQGGIRSISIGDISAFSFTDPRIGADLSRALDLIAASRDHITRDLLVSLPGGSSLEVPVSGNAPSRNSASRNVTVSYVIPAPVWKVSYRLDLGSALSRSTAPARFQGWAIIDNDSDTDWQDVELSLVAGRPVSFVQNLYPPYYLFRPTLPLAIAGTAEAVTYESNIRARAPVPAPAQKEATVDRLARSQGVFAEEESAMGSYAPAASAGLVVNSVLTGAAGTSTGDQFEFTVKNPVTLDRRMSAMIPLSDGDITAQKTLIFPGAQALPGRTIHPNAGAELTNTTGIKLPAGPITVYDGGSYAGDALIEFFNQGEKRLISWGEDLSVTGTAVSSGARTVTTVNISGGAMTINRRQNYEKKYRFKNTGPEARRIIIEHPITQGSTLAEPKDHDEATAQAYRFTREIPAGSGSAESASGEFEFIVREEIPLSERIVLVNLRPETLLSYSTNQEIPANIRSSLARVLELKRKAEDAEKARGETEARKNSSVTEQDRIRRNLEAAGNNTQQGQEYLRRLAGLDTDIDKLNADLEQQRLAAREAQAAYETYVQNLTLE